MARPGQRPMTRLPMLEAHRGSLERCVFCPKLCRSSCPVSNVEPRETLTPWGKMSLAYFAAHGDVPAEAAYAKPAWACTGCQACRGACAHGNDVTKTLLTARSSLVKAGDAPPGARRTVERFAAHEEATRQAVRELRSLPGARANASQGLLVGCTYARGAPAEARDAIDATSTLLGEPVAPVEACCGLPLLLAGDAEGFRRQAQTVAREVAHLKRLLVVDAGCAQALRVRYPEAGVKIAPPVELVVERAGEELGSLRRVADVGADPVRYHDPCQLGRGLGIYDAPRAILGRALGRPVDEFAAARESGGCSGAGGLLPATYPEVARGMAVARSREHTREGGGRIVTACASSLLTLRRHAGVPVDDLMTWLVRALRGPSSRGGAGPSPRGEG